ncbi:hypothetical protein TrispH2_002981 [Trichoplax sp. H2]|nr:hypothetical protein TrispH2_002981 [Trichoplax sp. H2]|eukprot:RDD45084.1 hypothetical protein TrispH2_002981 [Trichoplax sp. H2]
MRSIILICLLFLFAAKVNSESFDSDDKRDLFSDEHQRNNDENVVEDGASISRQFASENDEDNNEDQIPPLGKSFELPERRRGKSFEFPEHRRGKSFEFPEHRRGKSFELPERRRGKSFELPERRRGKSFELPERRRGKSFELPERRRGKSFEFPEHRRGKSFEFPVRTQTLEIIKLG